MAIDLRAAFENEPPVLDFIWSGFLAGTVGALVAPGATGKSFWALEAAMSIACSVAGGDLVGLGRRRPGSRVGVPRSCHRSAPESAGSRGHRGESNYQAHHGQAHERDG